MEATSVYQCHAFHESLPGGKSSGDMTLNVNGLSYSVGQLAGSLPFSQLCFTLGGASNRLVFITHPSVVDLTLYTSDLSILNNSFLLAHPECALHITRAKKQRQKHWAVFAAIALAILAVPVLFLWNMEYLSYYAAKQIPVSWETKLGEGVSAQYNITHTLMSKEKTDARLKPLVAPLLSALPNSSYKYQFTIVNEGSLNAFALPGGFVTIHSGLILKADTAEELLGVLAHEMSHVEERHGVRSIIGNVGIYTIASVFLGDVSGILASVSSAAPMLMSQRYSRTFETDADEKAAKLMLSANINPDGLPRFFEKMIAEEKAMLDKIDNKEAKTAIKTALTFLSTHPASEERMAHLRELSAAKKDGFTDLSHEFALLKEAVKEFVANSPAEAAVTAVEVTEVDATEVKPTDTKSESTTSLPSSEKENINEGNH